CCPVRCVPQARLPRPTSPTAARIESLDVTQTRDGDRTATAGVDQERIARAVREILLAIGEDPDRDGLQRTPTRVAAMYAEIFAGLHENPCDHLQVTFEADHDEMVMVRDIPLYSLCVPSKERINAVGGVKQARNVAVGDRLWTFDDDG